MTNLNHCPYVWMFSGVSSVKKFKNYINKHYAFYIMSIESPALHLH